MSNYLGRLIKVKMDLRSRKKKKKKKKRISRSVDLKARAGQIPMSVN